MKYNIIENSGGFNYIFEGAIDHGIWWYEQIDKFMRELKLCTHKREYWIKYHDNKVLFSTAYFDKNDEEIGYFIHDTLSVCGVFILKEPRIWSDELKNNPSYKLCKL